MVRNCRKQSQQSRKKRNKRRKKIVLPQTWSQVNEEVCIRQIEPIKFRTRKDRRYVKLNKCIETETSIGNCIGCNHIDSK